MVSNCLTTSDGRRTVKLAQTTNATPDRHRSSGVESRGGRHE